MQDKIEQLNSNMQTLRGWIQTNMDKTVDVEEELRKLQLYVQSMGAISIDVASGGSSGPETLTTLTLNNDILTYTDENGSVTEIDLSIYNQIPSLVAGDNIVIDNSDPWNPVINATGGSGVQSVVAGDFISVDSTDPVNPIVSVETTDQGSNLNCGDKVLTNGGQILKLDDKYVGWSSPEAVQWANIPQFDSSLTWRIQFNALDTDGIGLVTTPLVVQQFNTFQDLIDVLNQQLEDYGSSLRLIAEAIGNRILVADTDFQPILSADFGGYTVDAFDLLIEDSALSGWMVKNTGPKEIVLAMVFQHGNGLVWKTKKCLCTEVKELPDGVYESGDKVLAIGATIPTEYQGYQFGFNNGINSNGQLAYEFVVGHEIQINEISVNGTNHVTSANVITFSTMDNLISVLNSYTGVSGVEFASTSTGDIYVVGSGTPPLPYTLLLGIYNNTLLDDMTRWLPDRIEVLIEGDCKVIQLPTVDESNLMHLSGDEFASGTKTFGSDIYSNSIRVGRGGGNNMSNTVVGASTMPNGNAAATGNTAVGSNTLFSMGSSAAYSNNTAIGANVLSNSAQGTGNTGVGAGALQRLQFTNNNVAIGVSAGTFTNAGGFNTGPTDCIFIGNSTKSLANNNINQIVIGGGADGNGSNTVTIGNAQATDTFLRGRVRIQNYTTATRPAYIKGAIIFDSTLNKLLVGGATTWEVITSA